MRTWLRLVVLGPLIWLVALATALFASRTVTLALIAILFVAFLFEAPIREESSGDS
jgi:hypothetical protein